MSCGQFVFYLRGAIDALNILGNILNLSAKPSLKSVTDHVLKTFARNTPSKVAAEIRLD